AVLPGIAADAVLPDVTVERQRVPPEREQQDCACDQREQDRNDRADHDVEEALRAFRALAARRLRREQRGLGRRENRLGRHAASVATSPTISRPTSSAAPGPFGTTPASRPRERTAIRSQISSSSSRSVEMTSAAPPSLASRRIRSLTVAVVFTSSP